MAYDSKADIHYRYTSKVLLVCSDILSTLLSECSFELKYFSYWRKIYFCETFYYWTPVWRSEQRK